METPRVNVAVMLAMIVAMGYFWPHQAVIRKSLEETYPAAVLPYLKLHPLQGNLVNY